MAQPFRHYRKTATQLMRPYVPGESLEGISVAQCDTPELGGQIAMSSEDPSDKWYVSKAFFEANYEPVAEEVRT